MKNTLAKLSLRKGDIIKVIAGNDKGSTGRVLNIDKVKMRVLVEGVNVRKKHMKPSQSNPNGGIVQMEMPIAYSNVMLMDKNGKPTRVRVKRSPNTVEGKPDVVVRIAATTGEEI